MKIPIIATEQYPKAFGSIVPEIDVKDVTVFQKTQFSMVLKEVEPWLKNMDSVVLFGIESHVCVQQTALDLRQRGFEVHVPMDGTFSQNDFDKQIAIKRMIQGGVFTSTSESIIFELLKDSQAPEFKDISNILKEHKDIEKF